VFDDAFRARFAPAAAPVVRMLARGRVSPNAVTVASCLAGCAAAMLIAAGFPVAGLAVWLVSRLGDGLDGALARLSNRQSAFGGYLDITLDMLAYSAVVLGFAVAHPDHAVMWTAVLAGYVLVITSTLALSDAAAALGRRVSDSNRTFQFTPGYTEAGETSAMYVAWVLFPDHVWWLGWVWVAALVATTAQRTRLAARALR
jgi:phosphatidylglycerophosphate synthase